jgi:hypothetical protein
VGGSDKQTRGQCYTKTVVILTLLFIGLKYCGNLLPYCSIVMTLKVKLCFITLVTQIYCHSVVITDVVWLYDGITLN